MESEYYHQYSDLTGYLWTDERFKAGGHDLDIDDGSNVERDFKKEIENILKEYFDL